MAHAGPHGVRAFAGRLDHAVGRAVHPVEVVAQAAHQRVCPGSAVERVVAVAGVEAVVGGVAGELIALGGADEVLDP